MPSSRIRRTATAAATLTVAALLAVICGASSAGAQVPAWTPTMPVLTRTITLPQSLPVAPLPAPRTEEPARAASQVRLGAPPAAGPAPLTLDPGRGFTALGLLCDLPEARGEIVVRLRTSPDAKTWSVWYEVPLERQADDNGTPMAFIEALWTGEGRHVQISAQAATDDAPVELTGVRLVALDTGDSETAGQATFPTLPATATRVAGLSLTAAAGATAAEPPLVTRAAWGADESLRKADPVIAPLKMAFVHHTAGGNTYSQADAPALVRAIYTYHVKSLGWSDIGYNFLVDRFGTIYVGRYGGPRQGVVGAQVYGFNTGSTGISVIGTYTSEMPSPAALSALQRLLAWKLDLHGLDPLDTATMTCGATDRFKKGESVKFPVIAGHRDANYTECPGNTFYAGLPTIRKAVGSLFSPPAISGLKLSTRQMSPNRDGILDTVQVSYAISEPSQWTVQVLNVGGQSVRQYDGAGASVKVSWNGKNASGATVADGVYTLKMSATSAFGAMSTKTVQLTVDTVAPRPRDARLERATFSPNGDSWRDDCRLTYAPSEAASLRVSVLDAGGATRRTIEGWTAAAAAAERTLTWAGKVERSGKLVAGADGRYILRLELRDSAGNLRRMSYALTVDRTLGFATATPATISPNDDGVKDVARLGFTLTRRATVTVVIVKDGKTVRTLQPGQLAAGKRAVIWNGRYSNGTRAANGVYGFTVKATSTVASTDVVASFSADRYKPRLSVPAGQTLTLGQTAKAEVTAADPHSAEVELWCDVTNAKDVRVARVSLGWVTTGRPSAASWRPTSRGVYTLTFAARDRGGNREYAAVQTVLTVR